MGSIQLDGLVKRGSQQLCCSPEVSGFLRRIIMTVRFHTTQQGLHIGNHGAIVAKCVRAPVNLRTTLKPLNDISNANACSPVSDAVSDVSCYATFTWDMQCFANFGHYLDKHEHGKGAFTVSRLFQDKFLEVWLVLLKQAFEHGVVRRRRRDGMGNRCRSSGQHRQLFILELLVKGIRGRTHFMVSQTYPCPNVKDVHVESFRMLEEIQKHVLFCGIDSRCNHIIRAQLLNETQVSQTHIWTAEVDWVIHEHGNAGSGKLNLTRVHLVNVRVNERLINFLAVVERIVELESPCNVSTSCLDKDYIQYGYSFRLGTECRPSMQIFWTLQCRSGLVASTFMIKMRQNVPKVVTRSHKNNEKCFIPEPRQISLRISLFSFGNLIGNFIAFPWKFHWWFHYFPLEIW